MWQPMFLVPADGQWIVVILDDFSGAALMRWDGGADYPGWYSPDGDYISEARIPLGAAWAAAPIPDEAILEQEWNQQRG